MKEREDKLGGRPSRTRVLTVHQLLKEVHGKAIRGKNEENLPLPTNPEKRGLRMRIPQT